MLTVYGSKISYYTGKLEGYLRYKEIPYRFAPRTQKAARGLIEKTGTHQIPAVELPDGRIMTDTTPMIDWFEANYPACPVIPQDPLQAFVSRLLEDYAEEWLWRPAMHYRWSYKPDALLVSRMIVDEILSEGPVPRFVNRFAMLQRQRGFYVRRDGVNRDTWDHVESIYLNSLDRLSHILSTRPFLLGEVPTLADFGFFASMFRHFSQDPTPSEIMRTRAPEVFEWQARLWRTRASATDGNLLSGIPGDWAPFLEDMGATYLRYLCANATGFIAGRRRHDMTIQGVTYKGLPVSQYRVWCLERLRAHFHGLPEDTKLEARALLKQHGCWEPLWRTPNLVSRHDPEGLVPFHGRKVHYPHSRM